MSVIFLYLLGFEVILSGGFATLNGSRRKRYKERSKWYKRLFSSIST
ncbi:MAG: hypothetical protein II046_00755 [Clostridiales bacterium]|nr:hypothetical protein [Clostridiales bacterium]MBQ2155818.1 hypothetical protein [Clostridiales bacterium]MBQ5519239.1 hypothetical protein [Clostridiales bacterium]